jgi:hypothetical protein
MPEPPDSGPYEPPDPNDPDTPYDPLVTVDQVTTSVSGKPIIEED